MKSSRSGIKIFHTEKGKIRKDGVSLSFFLIQTAAVCFVMLAWWNALLSVFHMPFKKGSLYAWICVFVIVLAWAGRRFGGRAAAAAIAFAAAALWLCRDAVTDIYTWTVHNYPSLLEQYPEGKAQFSFVAAAAAVPVIDLLLAVQRRGRGKGWAGIVLAAPFFAAAAAGRFQTVLPAWLLVAGSVLCFALSLPGAGRVRGKFFVWKYAAAAAAVTAALVFVCFQAGKLLEGEKDAADGYYLKMRSAIRTEIIEGVQELLTDERQKEETEEESGEKKEDTQQSEEQSIEDLVTQMPASAQTPFVSEDLSPSAESNMGDLGSLAYFRPDEGKLSTLVVDERPTGTVYVAERLGITYEDNGWSEVNLVQSDSGPAHMIRDCRIYPDEMWDMLHELCGGWNDSSSEKVGAQISRELSERAVYDTNPGPTPAGKDFVEYFLFENHKGFCVHFATAAVLMYRYCGYTARYAEGYAIPASAFRQNESGKYEASITGAMGHAWCQVYDDEAETWRNAEHTPPAPENSSGAGPAADFAGERDGRDRTALNEKLFGFVPAWLAAAAGIAVLAVFLFFGQAAVRSAHRKRRFYEKAGGRGIREMYASVIKTARFQGVEIDNPLREDAAERLADAYREIKKEEWMWMYTRVMEDMFYRVSDEEEEWKKMRRLYVRFRKAAYRCMKPLEKWRFKYVQCL